MSLTKQIVREQEETLHADYTLIANQYQARRQIRSCSRVHT